MALKMNVSRLGLQIPDAYIRIDRLMGGKRFGWQAEVGIYASHAQHRPIDVFGVDCAFVDNEHPLATIYRAVKETPEFKNALDV